MILGGFSGPVQIIAPPVPGFDWSPVAVATISLVAALVPVLLLYLKRKRSKK